ncbi:MAG: glutamate mutase L, partial [Armatimonadota bacterium]|nr:glutamate mutase L [Armatimonadota bacterium]
MIIGSGGVLSHAPRRVEAAYMMLDAYQPEGITMLAVDSIFMMPQLGVLSTVHPEAAAQVFERDCLIKLGPVIAPVGYGREGEPAVTVRLGEAIAQVPFGALRLLPLGVNEHATVEIVPARGLDVGAGKGRPLTHKVEGGVVGLIIDARGRPLALPADPAERRRKMAEWYQALGLPVE